MLKRCTVCKIDKPYGDFGKDADTRDGFYRKCKPCAREYAKQDYAENRQRHLNYQKIKRTNPQFRQQLNDYSRNFRLSVQGRAHHLFLGAKASPRAKEFGFSLTLEHVLNGLQRGTCAVTGLGFDLKPHARNRQNPFAPSLDRINSFGPYSDQNVRVVIWQFNLMKGEISDAELYMVASAVVKGIERSWQ